MEQLVFHDKKNATNALLSSTDSLQMPSQSDITSESVAAIEAAGAHSVFLVAQFWTSAAVVNEPVADLCHADACCLQQSSSALNRRTCGGGTHTREHSLLFLRRVGVGDVLQS